MSQLTSLENSVSGTPIYERETTGPVYNTEVFLRAIKFGTKFSAGTSFSLLLDGKPAAQAARVFNKGKRQRGDQYQGGHFPIVKSKRYPGSQFLEQSLLIALSTRKAYVHYAATFSRELGDLLDFSEFFRGVRASAREKDIGFVYDDHTLWGATVGLYVEFEQKNYKPVASYLSRVNRSIEKYATERALWRLADVI